VEGVYDGEVSVKSIRERGDFGLGTFANLDVEMVILDGQVYLVRGVQEMSKCGRKSGFDLGPVDLVKYAEAFGATGLMIRFPEEIAPVLKRALDNRRGPVLIGVHVDYRDNHKIFEMANEDSFH
jgi:acetolactate synthase-1/2/3 large subunit